jgi:hypothetical protein
MPLPGYSEMISSHVRLLNSNFPLIPLISFTVFEHVTRRCHVQLLTGDFSICMSSGASRACYSYDFDSFEILRAGSDFRLQGQKIISTRSSPIRELGFHSFEKQWEHDYFFESRPPMSILKYTRTANQH